MLLWMNGRYINEFEASISPFDHGYLYGFTYFETFRTYKGQVILYQEHYNQLINKLNQLQIEMPYSVTDILNVIKQLARMTKDQESLFMISVSAGVTSNQLQLQIQSAYNRPNVVVYRTTLFPRKRGEEKSAIWIEADDNRTINENKHLGSLTIDPNVEGLLYSQRGIITEGIQSHIFFAKDGTLFTPSLTVGITPGVMRQWIINTASQIGYRVVEDMFIKQELEESYECFVVNSVDEIIPIANIGDIQFLGKDGTIYQRLHKAYIEEILNVVRKGE